MKALLWVVLAAVVAFSILNLPACVVNSPTITQPPAPTPTPITGTIVIQDVATGTCPINVWLDNVGPVTLSGGTVKTFTNVVSGNHTLAFTLTASTNCGSGSAPCTFYNTSGAPGTTGETCNPFLASGTVETVAITDNGCNQLSINCPN
jgi:hypothetical protein